MSLAVSTRGYFCEDRPLSIATRGYFCDIVEPEIPDGGGARSIPTYQLPDYLGKQLQQEDEELLLILSAFMRIID